MKEGWEVKKLGEVMKLQSGENLPAKKMQDGIYPVYGGNGVSGYHNDYNMMGENIIIGRVGALCGNVRYLRDPFWLTDNGFKVILNKGLTVDLRYLTLFLNFANLRQYAKQTAQPVISNVALQEVPVILPPLPEQERIVSILDAEFAKIDAVKAGAEKSLQHAKDLFQAALKKELTPKEGWETKKFNEEVLVINGRAYRKEELLSCGKYRVLRVGNFFTNDSWYYSDLELDEDKYCDCGDLLYAWSASFGPKIWDGEKVIYHYHIWKMIPSVKLDKYFLYYWLQSSLLTEQVMSQLHGTTMVHITKGIMESTTILYPPLPEQEQIVARLDTLSANCKTLQANYERTIALCDDMKQALLRKAFNGEL